MHTYVCVCVCVCLGFGYQKRARHFPLLVGVGVLRPQGSWNREGKERFFAGIFGARGSSFAGHLLNHTRSLCPTMSNSALLMRSLSVELRAEDVASRWSCVLRDQAFGFSIGFH